MAKIARPNTDMPIFGNAAVAADLKIFGTATESAAIEDLLTNANAKAGWSSGVDDNGFPAKSWFNAVGYTFSYITSYYLQQGVPEWNSNQEYFIDARVIASDGFEYASKTDNNSGNTPVGDTTNWRLAYLDTANTVAYTPTDDYNPVTKKWAEDNLAGRVVATAAEIRTGTDNEKVVTPLGVNDTIFGMGQTLQNVTGSRSQGVAYQNTTGRPILVNVLFSAVSDTTAFQVSFDGIVWLNAGRATAASRLSYNMVIPNNMYYRCNSLDTSLPWLELR